MKTKEIESAAWIKYPWTWRNNRGGIKTKHGYITYGLPTPPRGRQPDHYKGGDRIGWTDVVVTQDMVGQQIAVFTSIEIKGPGDRLAPGQIRWHNLVLQHGGISQVWKDKKGNIEIIKEKINE